MTAQPDTSLIVVELNRRAAGLSVEDRIGLAAELIGGPLVFTTSFGLEDQVLTHAIARSGTAKAGGPVSIATLDTGRMFAETYDVWALTEQRYDLRITPFSPKADAVEALVQARGINGFYASLEARKACCAVRKIEPLGRALKRAAGWITGLRGDQSVARTGTPFAEADSGRGLIKINPLHDWTRAAVADHIRVLEIPYNALHDQGFLSIGCQPCTRAVKVGEGERAGRWWWEHSAKECGLHADDTPAATPIAA